ncbi:MAG: DUF4838 domain-containing protein [Planctomycetota bacterium]|jgi:hypothetical protein
MENSSFRRLILASFLFIALVNTSLQAEKGKFIISVDGKSACTLVRAENATEPEKHAVKELVLHLEKVTGGKYTVVSEKDLIAGTPAIYIGWTKYAEEQGIALEKLGEEEWVIKTVGNNLIISGGRPKGTLYSVYEFLEDYVGCHWLSRSVDVIPTIKSLSVGPINVQNKPWFIKRQIHSPTGCPDNQWNFLIRNKNYRYGFRGRRDFYPAGAFYPVDGSSGSVHTFQNFINAKDWFETHPEYFSLGRDGKRIPVYSGSGPGQLCLTHPDVMKISLEKLRGFIKADRAAAKEKGTPPPKLYWFSQCDKYDSHCQCTDCQAIAKREGSESGPLINFMNILAKGIEKKYPEILVGTIAYNQTAVAPKNIRPRKNVHIAWCDVYSHVDLMRPLKDPYNSRNYEEITGWAKIAPSLGIGDDYWTSLGFYRTFPTPYSIIHSLTSDLKLFADLGCTSFFAEAPTYMDPNQNFKFLRMWLGYKMLDDPHQNSDKLIKIFMDGYYGAGSQAMYKFLKYQEKRILADAQYMLVRNEPFKLAFLDVEFFKTCQQFLDEATAAVEKGSKQYYNIGDERLIVDGALLHMWQWLERKRPEAEVMPFDKEKVIARYGQEWKDYRHYNIFYSFQKNSPSATKYYSRKYKMDGIVCDLFRNPNIPEQFKNIPKKDIADFNWLTFSNIRPRLEIIDDDDALGKMTAKSGIITNIMAAEKGGDKLASNKNAAYDGTLDFGATGGPTVKLTNDKLPKDEKYHLYKIGRVGIRPKTMVWGFGRRLGVIVDRIYEPDTDNPGDNIWNAYISLKVAGPAYVKNSKQENGVYMDRVILVKPQPGEEFTAEEKKIIAEERRKLAGRPTVEVPAVAAVEGGDPLKVNWEKAATTSEWSKMKSTDMADNLTAKFAHDGINMYIRLEDKLGSRKLISASNIYSGDDWEFLFSEKRGLRPYRQIAVNPDEKSEVRSYGVGKWESGAKIVSEKGAGYWRVSFAFPLNKLTTKGIKSGDEIFLNILRGGQKNYTWSNTHGDRFHNLTRFGKLILK